MTMKKTKEAHHLKVTPSMQLAGLGALCCYIFTLPYDYQLQSAGLTAVSPKTTPSSLADTLPLYIEVFQE